MAFNTLFRDGIQFTLIKLYKGLKPVLNSKNVLFSRFMASDDNYIMKQAECSYVLHTKDVAVSRRIYIGKDDEYLKTVKAISWVQQLRSNKNWKPDLLIDIGANIGHISIPLVKKNYVNSAMGFEPDVNNFKLFKINTILNGVDDRIRVKNMALGARPDEELVFELSEDNFGDHRVKVSNDDGLYQESKRKKVTVKSSTLDDSLKEEDHPENFLVWIDVQGYEGAVLSGCTSLIQKKVAMGLEFWPYGLNRAKTFELLLESLAPYQHFYDLDAITPQPIAIDKLRTHYAANSCNDTFMLDILVL